MIVRLTVSNFLSVDAPIVFSMQATKEAFGSDRVAEIGGEKLLQVGAIWGGNASGKSTFCHALRFAQHLVVHGTRAERPITRSPFRLRKDATKEPTCFEFEIITGELGQEQQFRYRFEVDAKRVLAESLVEIRKASEREVFSRALDAEGHTKITLQHWQRRGVNESDRQFADFVARGTNPNQLFLHEAMDRNLTDLSPVFRWFRDQLVVLSPHDADLSLEVKDDERGELRDYMADLLQAADTGIEELEAVEVPISSLPMPPKLMEELSAKIDEHGSSIMSPEGQRFSLFKRNEEVVASRIVTIRRDKDGDPVHFEMPDESDGTLRLFDLAPMFYNLSRATSRSVYVVDELDRSMHSHLTQLLLKRYFEAKTKDTRSQLIFTSHDTSLIDNKLLRRDEIWFIDRLPTGATALESLADYKVRHDKDLLKSYNEGRFSGVPRFKVFGGRPRNLQPAG